METGETNADEEVSQQEENESSSEEEDEIEPKLQYERLGNDLIQILRTDAASCLAVHTKVLALGTHSGVIHILDHLGNSIRTSHLHATTVNQISIDENGDYIASCSDDGKVVVLGLYNSDHNRVVTQDKPVQAVALDPNFYKSNSGRKFIIGDDRVLIYEKTYLSRYKDTVLHQGEGPVRNIRWKGQFVAWATDLNARVYDLNSRQIITRIKREFDSRFPPEQHRCNMFWKDDLSLLIGWADTVEICVVKKRSTAVDAALKGLPDYYVEILSIFTTNSFVNGIAPMAEMLVTLTVLKSPNDKEGGTRPHLSVLEPQGSDSFELSRDILSVKGSQEYRCKDYHLESLPEEGLYFIVSPKDVVVAKPRDEDDHIAWLLAHKKFQEAMKVIESGKDLKRHNKLMVGRAYMNHLMKEKRYSEAAELCPSVLGHNKSLWEEEVYMFAHIQQLATMTPYLPQKDPTLDPAIYEMVLNEYLHKDPKKFVKLVREWPSNLYSIPAVSSAVLDRLAIDPYNTSLLEGLSELYTYEKKYEKALDIYLQIGNKDRVFDLIRQNGLIRSIHDKLAILMTLNPDEATSLLLENVDKVPVNVVVEKLNAEKKPEYVFKYLSRLFHKDSEMGQEYNGLLVELYAEYEKENLLKFLQSSSNYPLETALELCQQRPLVREAIYLLGRMGNTKQALQLITQDLEDINSAIKFCMEHNDKELWDDLIKYSVDKPEFIQVLLQNIGTHVDPIILIRKIPDDLKIPELRDNLVKILQDYNLQISLREGCKKILVFDCYSLLEKLNKLQKRGFHISDDHICQVCNRKLLVNNVNNAVNIRVFHCRHAFHENCMPIIDMEACNICSAQKRRPGSSGDHMQ